MHNPLAKTPFLFLLLPLVAGILLEYYLKLTFLSLIFFTIGVIGIIASYYIPYKYRFRFRWLFGVAASFLLASVGVVTTQKSEDKFSFIFADKPHIYKGIVIDIPQPKPHSIAYKVCLPDYQKQIVCYVQNDTADNILKPGDEFLFESVIVPFKNQGNPNEFDYVEYMHNQGYAGTAYISKGALMKTGAVSSSLEIQAQLFRFKIINFYKSLGFTENQYTILSALTLGYQDALSDDLKQSFRATGTAHVLSVSGLHVGIIYALISFLMGFIRKTSHLYRIKPVVIIIVLWCYAFITGLPPSVIRASLMLTVFCLAELFGRKGFSLNGLYISAFFMLLVCPLWLFDVSFQLSFISMLAILYLLPKVVNLYNFENRYLRNIWQTFALSVVAQLGTSPLCLYYFGTFPTYFFVSNMLIVPLVTCITYSAFSIIVAKGLSYLLPDATSYLFYLPVRIMQLLVDVLTEMIHFFENLPFALISDMRISGLNLLILIAIILCLIIAFHKRKADFLIAAVFLFLVILLTRLSNNISDMPDKLVIYNRYDATEIRWEIEGKRYELRKDGGFTQNGFYKIGDTKMLILGEDITEKQFSDQSFDVDILLLRTKNVRSLDKLNNLFSPKQIILDGSMPHWLRKRLVNESQKLKIRCYDVGEKGAFTLNL